jgi:hypothetical protein
LAQPSAIKRNQAQFFDGAWRLDVRDRSASASDLHRRLLKEVLDDTNFTNWREFSDRSASRGGISF